jgi:hypothetical protein
VSSVLIAQMEYVFLGSGSAIILLLHQLQRPPLPPRLHPQAIRQLCQQHFPRYIGAMMVHMDAIQQVPNACFTQARHICIRASARKATPWT